MKFNPWEALDVWLAGSARLAANPPPAKVRSQKRIADDKRRAGIRVAAAAMGISARDYMRRGLHNPVPNGQRHLKAKSDVE